ncbi:glutathione-regulated potassium-efflux system protein KefC [Candidatus Cyanaurora vandensis]|uniref:glutathione-regulated potassium-efflux system protein KefC n=1 Tax=Candidatus Cyanaurora vandensis TaxID=2714958 RepID=UPI00257D1CE6|nr:glutathione-regulated potassium-efflux system protein KefC [Candidatus Cyanaurora vandensis]
MDNLFFQAFIYLLAAVLTVPVAQRLGLGSVLGYLLAGVAIGPFGLQLVGQEGEDVMHFAEFGVVMMLFLVGLELQPSLLWRLRVPILGLGGLQVVGTALAVGGIGLLLGMSWQVALAVGLIFAMSSTAIVLQTLNEKGLLKTEAGQSSFSVLLFQDIAVIPILALLPLLASEKSLAETTGLPWQQTLLVIGLVGGIVLAGRFLMRPVFRFIASTGLREMFTATALLLVIGVALAVQAVDLSPALGTFVAGVVLADSEYRHELESDIEPFKGLLLGLFFIAVGAGINFALFFREPFLILGLVIGLVVVKFSLLLGLGRFFKLEWSASLLFAFALAQGGEFAFVLFSFATQNNILTTEVAEPLIVVVALSMVFTPLLMIVYERFVQPRFTNWSEERETDEIDEKENPVIIAGFGRFGQIVGRMLIANGCRVTVLDINSNQIDMLRRFGFKLFYGDASRLDLLHAAGANQAKLFVVAVDDREKSIAIIDLVQKHFPHLKILARAIDRQHAYEMINRKVEVIERETFGSALELGVEALQLLGVRAYRARRVAQLFKVNDEHLLHEMAKLEGDEKTIAARSRQNREELERLLQADDQESGHEIDRAWDVTNLIKNEST